MITMLEIYKQYCLKQKQSEKSLHYNLPHCLKYDKKNKSVWKLVNTNAQIRIQIKDWVNIIFIYLFIKVVVVIFISSNF